MKHFVSNFVHEIFSIFPLSLFISCIFIKRSSCRETRSIPMLSSKEMRSFSHEFLYYLTFQASLHNGDQTPQTFAAKLYDDPPPRGSIIIVSFVIMISGNDYWYSSRLYFNPC